MYEEDEFDGVNEPEQQLEAEDPIAAIEELASESEQQDRAMAEIDARFYKASLYKDLLQSPLFGNADGISQEVKHECDAFFRRRLHETMAGVNRSGEGTLLTEKRIAVLALVADMICTNPKLQVAFGIKNIQSQLDDAGEESPAQPPQRPQVLVRPNPVAASARKPTIGGKPVSRVVPKPRPGVAPKQARPVAKPAPILDANGDPKPTGVPVPAQNPINPPKMVKQAFVHPDGDRIEHNTRIYKVTHKDLYDAREFGPKYVDAINGLDEGESILLGNGQQVGRTANGLVKIILSDVTPMRPSSSSVPFPSSKMAMEHATANQASETLDKLDGNTQKILNHL